MKLQWTDSAIFGLTRLENSLAPLNKRAAAQVIQTLAAAPNKLLANPRIGYRLEEFAPREIRRIIVGRCELRYEIAEHTIFILRIWHAREDR